MERYQQAMVNIMTRRTSPQQVPVSSGASSRVSNSGSSPITSTTVNAIMTLTCPAGTPQDPSYLTIPFTAPSEEPVTAKDPKRAKEQEASMFIAGNLNQLIIGMSSEHIIRQNICKNNFREKKLVMSRH